MSGIKSLFSAIKTIAIIGEKTIDNIDNYENNYGKTSFDDNTQTFANRWKSKTKIKKRMRAGNVLTREQTLDIVNMYRTSNKRLPRALIIAAINYKIDIRDLINRQR